MMNIYYLLLDVQIEILCSLQIFRLQMAHVLVHLFLFESSLEYSEQFFKTLESLLILSTIFTLSKPMCLKLRSTESFICLKLYYNFTVVRFLKFKIIL